MRRGLRTGWAALALSAALLGGARGAAGLSLAALTLEELGAAADVVVRGRCIDRVATRRGGRIDSIARFAVLDRLVGDAADVVEVHQWGGRSGDRHTVAPGAPLSEPGDEAVLFLAAEPEGTYRIVGAATGYLPVVPSPLARPAVRVWRTFGPEFAGAGTWPLERFAERVRRLPRAR